MSDELVEAVHLEASERMTKVVEHTRSEFAGVRSGRANSGLVEKLPIDYYGSTAPLQQLASFSVPEARMLVISPFDKGSIQAIERAIRDANLGLNPSNDGAVIRLGFPVLTEERRKEFVKIVKSRAEDARVAVRNVRRFGKDSFDALKSEVGEDEIARGEKELDALTRQHVDLIDDALKRKEAELLEV